MKITIKDKEIELKQSIRAMIIYENIMGETFQPKGVKEILCYFYAVILSSDKDIVLEWEDFLDIIDTNPELIKDFSVWMTALSKQTEKLKKA